MTIQVELIDGTYCRVVQKGLQLLLSRELVKRFRRSSGWAVIGVDPLRAAKQSSAYSGPERRKSS
ncbi:MAG: GSU3473 family protein [Desulfuromonadales bacterium]